MSDGWYQEEGPKIREEKIPWFRQFRELRDFRQAVPDKPETQPEGEAA